MRVNAFYLRNDPIQDVPPETLQGVLFPETIKRGQILFILELPDVVYITYSDGTSIYYIKGNGAYYDS